jgi:plastocyanin
MRMQHKLVAAVAAGAVGVGAAVAGVADATTGPAPHTLVNVAISDTAIKLSKNQVQDVTFVDFYIHNNGKLSHTLVVGAQKSVVVKAGERVHFYVGFPVFGWYRYHVGLNGKPQMKGRFHIDSPQPPD